MAGPSLKINFCETGQSDISGLGINSQVTSFSLLREKVHLLINIIYDQSSKSILSLSRSTSSVKKFVTQGKSLMIVLSLKIVTRITLL